MSRKPLGKDQFGVQKVMRLGDYFGDSMGRFSLNIIANLSGQLTYFYTDKVGMAAGAVATVFMLCKILDAFTDLIMGYIVDHTKPGKEKYRPWMLKAGIPAGIMLVLMFTVPKAGQGLQLAYVMITNLLLSAVFYTAIAIPYASLMVVRTNSTDERAKMGTWRAASGYVSGMIVAIVIIPATNMLGGTQSAWIKVGVILGACIILAMLICYLTSQETATEKGNEAGTAVLETEEEETVSFKDAILKLFHNKYWVMTLVLNLLACVIYALANGSNIYYCKWIYGNDNLVALLGSIGMIPTFLGFVLVGPMIKKFGVVKTLKISFLIGIAANALRIFNPYDIVFNAVCSSASTFANIPMMCLLDVLTTMTIDYNEYRYGVKMVASSNSASSFGTKVAGGLGSALIGWCLALANYDATLEAATTATKYAIFTFSIYIPLAIFAVMLLISCRFDLEAKLPQIREEIKARKAKAE